MSRAWDKAKQGAHLLGKIGLYAGAVVGAMSGPALMAGGVFASLGAAVVGGALVTAAIWAVEGAVAGGIIGAAFGAVTDKPKKYSPMAELIAQRRAQQGSVTKQPAPSLSQPEQAEPTVDAEQLQQSAKYQLLVAQSRAGDLQR